jgi:hypothetical protein
METGDSETDDSKAISPIIVSDAPSGAEPLEENTLSPLAAALLNVLSEADRRIWEPILRAGTEIQSLPSRLPALREDFRTMDRTRFTSYILDHPGADLRPVRTSVQIKDPMTLLLKWDEMGMLILYGAI